MVKDIFLASIEAAVPCRQNTANMEGRLVRYKLGMPQNEIICDIEISQYYTSQEQ